MNTEHLHYFELAYLERNFSAAARRVPCSPQGLTKAIRSLEKELDVTLFNTDPISGRPTPTEYATELFEFCSVYDSNVRLLNESFRRISGRETYQLKIGCSLGILGLFGPDFISTFEQQNPNVEVQKWEMSDALCDQGLINGEYDLALTISPFPSQFTVTELYRCPRVYWVNRQNPLSELPVLHIKDYEGQDVAIPGKGFKCLELLKEEARRNKVTLGRIYEMSELFQVYEFVLENKGLGFSVRHVTQQPAFNLSPDVVSIPVDTVPWSFGISHLSTHALSRAEKTFWDWTVHCARLLPSDPVSQTPPRSV